jgi:hypothetical protein
MLEPGKDNARAFASIRDVVPNTERGIRQAYFRTGKDLTDELSRQMLAKNKSGRIYRRKIRGGGRRRHQAAANGQTAANRSGAMRRARGFQLSGSDQLEFGIRDKVDYARFLEEGTSRMGKKPSLGNSVKAQEKNTENNFIDSLKGELTR